MKIESSHINMSGSRNLLEKYEKRESLRMWIGNERPGFEGQRLPAHLVASIQDDLVKISEKAKNVQKIEGDDYAALSKEGEIK